MFQSAYQDGDCVEVFSPAGKNPAAEWKLGGKVVRLYEKGIKGYMLAVSGGAASKMQLPKAPKGQLGLRQRHLVLQVHTATSNDKPFSVELGLTDTAGTRRRLVLSSSFRVLHCTPLHAQIPLYGLDRHRGSWANLSIDLAGLTALCFRADAFRTLDYIVINPTCRLRKIFTMKGTLHDDAPQESGKGDDRNGHPAASLSGLNDAPASAPQAPVPIRVAFPPGVVPTPRNWVVSVHTLQRFACRNGPPPSPSRGSPSTTGSTKKGLKARQTTSPRQISLARSPASPYPTAATLHLSVEARGMSPRTSGSAEGRGTPSPRLHEKLVSTPSSHLGSRASPRGILQPRSSLSPRGSSSSSTRISTTPSPLGTPARTSGSSVRRRGTPEPSSTSSSTLEATTPRRISSAGSLAVGPVESRGMAMSGEIVGSPALLGRNVMDAVPSFRGTSRHATTGKAETPGSATGRVVDPTGSGYGDQLGGKGSRGILPARQRASAASLSADRMRRMRDQMAIADNGSDSGGEGGRGDRMTRMSEEDWRGAGDWNVDRTKLAPAWSFVGESLSQGISQVVEPRPKSSSCEGNLSALPPGELAVAASRDSALIGESETTGVGSELVREWIQGQGGGGRLGVEVVPSALPTASEIFPDEDGVDGRRKQNGHGDGVVVSPKRFAAAASRRSSKGVNAVISDASPQSCRSPSAPAPIAVSAAAGTSAALGTLKRSSPDSIVARPKEGGEMMNKSTIPTPAPTSSFSPTVDGSSTASRSLALSVKDSRSSDRGTMVRSPMSARFDVLQSLLVPSVMGDQDRRPEHERLVLSTEMRSTQSEVRLGLKERTGGGGHGSGVMYSKHAGETDVLEGPVVHSAITGGPSSSSSSSRSSICGDAGRGNTKGVCRIVNDIARRRKDRPTFSVDGGSNDKKIGDGSDRPRTPHAVANTLQSIRARPVDNVDLKYESGEQTGSASTGNERVRVNGIGNGVGEEGKPALSSLDGTEDFLQLPSFLARSENERLGAEGKTSVDRSELDELRRKEIALLDLEESFHTEFGSVDLKSLSPEVGLSPKDLSQATVPPVENDVEADPPTAAKSPPRRRCHAKPSDLKTGSSGESQRYPQQADACDDGKSKDIDVDSVVLGSRDSAGSEALEGEDKAEGTCRHDSLAAAGEDRGASEKAESRRQKGGERAPSQTKGADSSDLYFDPILNCYYDRVADKYYGLR